MAAVSAAEAALWTRVKGDDWRISFTTADDVTDWDDTTIVAQLRAGATQSDTLIATNVTAEDVTANITVTADFTAGELEFHFDDLATDDIAPGRYTFEVQVEVDGDVQTVLTHWLLVVDQVAVG
jgi:ABC-type transport system substrate-binding protein